MSLKWWACGLGLLAVLVATPAEARETGLMEGRGRQVVSRSPHGVKPLRHWYGWQILTVDAASLVLVLPGLATRQEVPLALGTATFVMGAPVVHGLHHGLQGDGWRAWASFGMRATVPMVTLSLASWIAWYCDDASCEEGNEPTLLAAAAAPMVLTSVVDAVAFAYDRGRTKRRSGPTWAPSIGVLPQREGNVAASAGLVGTF